ncbi:MAG: hypothetical protein Q8O09_01560 [Bacillota bacterium]|nr:hypothetical protein [Bacillota bacterium]
MSCFRGINRCCHRRRCDDHRDSRIRGERMHRCGFDFGEDECEDRFRNRRFFFNERRR